MKHDNSQKGKSVKCPFEKGKSETMTTLKRKRLKKDSSENGK